MLLFYLHNVPFNHAFPSHQPVDWLCPVLVCLSGCVLFVIDKSLRFGIKNIIQKSIGFGIGKYWVSKKSTGFGIGNIWYQKKYRIWYRKIFGIEKVSDSVLDICGIEKSIRFGIGKYLVSKKVSDLISEIFGYSKKFWIWFRSDFWYCHTLPAGQGPPSFSLCFLLSEHTSRVSPVIFICNC